MLKNMIITIDGPAGSGKSTSAKLIARRLGFTYLDTGAMYRAITYLALKNNALNDLNEIIRLSENSKIDLSFIDGITKVTLNGEDVTSEIRSLEVNSNVSEVSAIPEVRKALVHMQQAIGDNNNIVAEGRDTGTTVFPKADVKIFLIASLVERAKRRLREFQEKGEDVSFQEIELNLSKRDKIDSQRVVSPLKKASDAIEIDTSNISIDEQVELILDKISEIAKLKGFDILFLKEVKS
ncbi:MAG: (d)CMP kinase [Bacteroidota bacterium]|nr:(d)CMP kinase [Bacteroidota bacterium]